MESNNVPNYKGRRALMMLRVSTPIQEEGFGLPAQEKEIRQKLISPLNLRLDEEKHIIRDSYTGLEFRQRPALERILEMAKRGEFDILCVDVLDRLGRKGLEREIYRMQLKELGVIILSTDPSEHADDDTPIGELIRLLRGYKAEQEVEDTKRRTMNGRRAKAEGRQKDGSIGERKVVGSGHRIYGYKYLINDRGRRDGIQINNEIIYVEEDGTQWTEVKVVVFVFELAANGVGLKRIATILNEKGIPTPYALKGIKKKTFANKGPIWHTSVMHKMLNQSAYWGEYRQFRTKAVGRKSGMRYTQRQDTIESEQIIVPVPAIVTKELSESVQKKLERNRQEAIRNNRNPEDALLRGGFVKCSHCMCNMQVHRYTATNPIGKKYPMVEYRCGSRPRIKARCVGTSLLVKHIDQPVWNKAIEILRNPLLIDERVNEYKTEDPTADRRRNINKKLKEASEQEEAMRENLSNLMKTRRPNAKTIEYLNGQLDQLGEQIEKWEAELKQEECIHYEWKEIQLKLNEIHEECERIREKLDDPNYEPSYKNKRDIMAFLGIQALVYRRENGQRFEIKCNPPDIVSLLSQTEDRVSAQVLVRSVRL